MTLRVFHRLVGLEGVVALLAGAVAGTAMSVAGVAALTSVLPAVLIIGGLLLAWKFERGRALLGLLAVAIGGGAFQIPGIEALLTLPAAPLALGWGVILAAAAVTGAKARPGATLWRPAAAVVLIAWAVVVPVVSGLSAELTPLLSPRWLPQGWVTAVGLPEAVLLPAALLFLALLGWAGWRDDATARAAAWGLPCGLAAVASWPAGGSGICLAGAAAAFTVAAVEEIHSLAFRDPLTGLPARRALEAALARLTAPSTVAMVDVDHFKRFNDTFGHDVGDQVLTMVASRLAQVPGAQAFRYGGEEFTLIFPGLALGDAVPVLEGARRTIEGTTFTLRAPDRPRRRPTKGKTRRPPRSEVVAVTVSIGAAAPAPGEPAAVALRTADQALYRAKEGGRNRVTAG